MEVLTRAKSLMRVDRYEGSSKFVQWPGLIDFLPGTVAIEGYLQFEHVFLCKTYYFRFWLLQLN
jgi:hypothetical protein